MNNQGISRGFAFVDYMTAEEAEKGQKAHNGALLEDSHIRVAYGTPGRTGASILGGHHITSVVCSTGQSSFPGPFLITHSEIQLKQETVFHAYRELN